MILKSLQLIYNSAAGLKNKLYDRGYFKKTILKIPVISVGNLSVGGTGKTPCVYLLATQIHRQNPEKKICIISRSYKGSIRHPQKVNLQLRQATQLFGDEPCLLQKKLPRCHVWAGPRKYLTAQAAVASEQPDLIIVDDGFSHRQLHRQFDLVLLDATMPLSDLQTLPLGRLREPVEQLNRCHMVLITKCNLTTSENVKALQNFVLTKSLVTAENIFLADAISQVNNLNPEKDSLYVFSGLGQPESFRNMLTKLKFKIQEFRIFVDHFIYSDADLDSLIQHFELQKKTNPQLRLVTTAKDSIKLRNHRIEKLITVVDYDIKIENNKMGSFLEKISQVL